MKRNVEVNFAGKPFIPVLKNCLSLKAEDKAESRLNY